MENSWIVDHIEVLEGGKSQLGKEALPRSYSPESQPHRSLVSYCSSVVCFVTNQWLQEFASLNSPVILVSYWIWGMGCCSWLGEQNLWASPVVRLATGVWSKESHCGLDWACRLWGLCQPGEVNQSWIECKDMYLPLGTWKSIVGEVPHTLLLNHMLACKGQSGSEKYHFSIYYLSVRSLGQMLVKWDHMNKTS